MPPTSSTRAGWRGVCLVAITYIYFLIFAQFAFLKRLTQLNIADAHLKAVMAAMAFGGILLSLLTPRISAIPSPARRLQLAFFLCGSTAALTLFPINLTASIAIAFLIGSGLGLLTVTLVTHLRLWIGESNALLKVGLGTGIGYFVCNLPPLFATSPTTQSLTAASLCLIGILIASGQTAEPHPPPPPAPATTVSFPRVLLGFTALVWLDSAAFFIIQNTPALKAGTWQGSAHLWINGVLHLLAAILSALLLRRRGLAFVLAAALLALASACLLLLDPSRALLASAFYPIGVSLYSVALVAYPSLLATAASTQDRARKTGWIYATAGWFGSAMGIGMGQNLGHVPPAFVALAAAAVLTIPLVNLFRQRRRELIATGAILTLAFLTDRAIPTQPTTPSPIDRGHQVYIAEGCINCHSQYVRPNSPDVTLWGPAQTLDELRSQRPPLIGNRRQGPDLAEVGNRRSPLWLKAHFVDPRAISPASFMPSYAHLFTSTRGDDLIDYLQSLQGPSTPQHQRAEQTWQPSPSAIAIPTDGAALFTTYCATCHTPTGPTRTAWQQSFRRLPPIFTMGPFQHLPPTDTPTQRRQRLARIIKFGIPASDMAGHEYLPDHDIASLSLYVDQLIPPPTHPGEAP